MTRVRWMSFGLSILGVMACSGVDWHGLKFGKGYLIGNILIFLSVLGSAFYNTYCKRVLETHSPLQVLLYSYYALLVVLLPLTVALEPSGFANLGHYSRTVWIGLAILAIFQYFLSMVIFLNVLTRLDATQAALSNYLIPFFGVLIAALVLHERLTSFMIAGGAAGIGEHAFDNGLGSPGGGGGSGSGGGGGGAGCWLSAGLGVTRAYIAALDNGDFG